MDCNEHEELLEKLFFALAKLEESFSKLKGKNEVDFEKFILKILADEQEAA